MMTMKMRKMSQQQKNLQLASRTTPANEAVFQTISCFMDKAFEQPSAVEKTLANKKMQLEIEAISISTELARKREKREDQMAKDSKISLNLADLLKIATTPGLSPATKEEAHMVKNHV